MSVHTSDLPYAGTNAHVYISIYGERGWTPPIVLDDPNKDDNERDEVGVYDFYTTDVGRPIKLLVWHDNLDHPNNGAGWHLSEVNCVHCLKIHVHVKFCK